ncbi:hypothetical protein GGI42DRAFT_310129 [Trichoderma sp. SZMC 28013]
MLAFVLIVGNLFPVLLPASFFVYETNLYSRKEKRRQGKASVHVFIHHDHYGTSEGGEKKKEQEKDEQTQDVNGSVEI